MSQRTRSRATLAAVLVVAVLCAVPRGAWAGFTAASGERELASIEVRFRALVAAPRRDPGALAALDRRASALAAGASRHLAALREAAAERDEDMTAVVAGREWQGTEALLVKLRFRIAAIQLERALAGDRDAKRLAREAADGFSAFVEAPDPALAGESRYGRGLARIAAGEREAGVADLRAAARFASVAPRARLALAETLADAGDRRQALAIVAKELGRGRLPRDLELRAKLLELRLLVAEAGRLAARSASADDDGGDRASARRIATLLVELRAAGEPFGSAALALLAGHEDLLPADEEADASILELRADAAARSGNAAGALELYRAAVARDAGGGSVTALEGAARAALASGAWREAREAVASLRARDVAWTRELALLDLRAAYGAWQEAADASTAAALAEAADASTAAALAAAADAVRGAAGVRADDLAEAAYRAGEAARAQDDLAGAIAAFASIDAPDWRVAAATATLQARVLRHVREPAREPRDALLADLAAFLDDRGLPDDARATVVVLDATLRTTPEPGASRTGAAREAAGGDGAAHPASSRLDPGAQRAALERVRAFPERHPGATALLPAALRARALLEVETGAEADPAMLAALPEDRRAEVAAAVAGDLREVVAVTASSRDPARREEARRALAGALAFAALASSAERGKGRLALARSALDLGEPQTALDLYRVELETRPGSLSALRGLAVASDAAGDAAAARAAWARLAATVDLPAALREEAEREAARLSGAAPER